MRLTHLSLCSGIGGLDLAAELAGFETIGQCEVDKYASQVLAKNFKGVKNYGDIRTITADRLAADGIRAEEITAISAGIPCQPYSLAGKGLGDCDSRDLEQELVRVVGELKPKWLVVENTPGLFARKNQQYFERILNDISALGYQIGWGLWGACDVGAWHKRERVFIIAHANVGESRPGTVTEPVKKTFVELGTDGGSYGDVSHSVGERRNQDEVQFRELIQSCQQEDNERIYSGGMQSCGICSVLSDTSCERKIERRNGELSKIETITEQWKFNGRRMSQYVGGELWQVEPDVGRVANGVSARVDRLRCLGNAVVPQQAYPIFKAIADFEINRSPQWAY